MTKGLLRAHAFALASMLTFMVLSVPAGAVTLTLTYDQVDSFDTVVGNLVSTGPTTSPVNGIVFQTDQLPASDVVSCASSLCSIHYYNYARLGISGLGDLSACDAFYIRAQGSPASPYGGSDTNVRLVAMNSSGAEAHSDTITTSQALALDITGLDRSHITFLGFDILRYSVPPPSYFQHLERLAMA